MCILIICIVYNNASIQQMNTLNEYNNTYHRTIKMNPVDVKDDTYIDSSKEVNYKDPKFQVGDYVKYQSTKTFLLKDILQLGVKKIL